MIKESTRTVTRNNCWCTISQTLSVPLIYTILKLVFYKSCKFFHRLTLHHSVNLSILRANRVLIVAAKANIFPPTLTLFTVKYCL